LPEQSGSVLRSEDSEQYMSDSPIFAGLEPHKWKVCVPRLGGFGTLSGTQADGL
jgi:hypothetical protein